MITKIETVIKVDLKGVKQWMAYDSSTNKWAQVAQEGMTYNECHDMCTKMNQGSAIWYEPKLMCYDDVIPSRHLTLIVGYRGQNLLQLIKNQCLVIAQGVSGSAKLHGLHLRGEEFKINGDILIVNVTIDVETYW